MCHIPHVQKTLSMCSTSICTMQAKAASRLRAFILPKDWCNVSSLPLLFCMIVSVCIGTNMTVFPALVCTIHWSTEFSLHVFGQAVHIPGQSLGQSTGFLASPAFKFAHLHSPRLQWTKYLHVNFKISILLTEGNCLVQTSAIIVHRHALAKRNLSDFKKGNENNMPHVSWRVTTN